MNDKHNFKEEYISRINRVVDYIEKNISKNLSLEELAREAYFSKYHFHRIFNIVIIWTSF
jgi:AraC family transcriptional regulator